MTSREESSMQEQTPLSQAQNSVDRFSNAVAKAQSHPSADMIHQAREAEERASNALSQAQVADHTEAVVRVKERFEEEQARLDETHANLNG